MNLQSPSAIHSRLKASNECWRTWKSKVNSTQATLIISSIRLKVNWRLILIWGTPTGCTKWRLTMKNRSSITGRCWSRSRLSTKNRCSNKISNAMSFKRKCRFSSKNRNAETGKWAKSSRNGSRAWMRIWLNSLIRMPRISRVPTKSQIMWPKKRLIFLSKSSTNESTLSTNNSCRPFKIKAPNLLELFRISNSASINCRHRSSRDNAQNPTAMKLSISKMLHRLIPGKLPQPTHVAAVLLDSSMKSNAMTWNTWRRRSKLKTTTKTRHYGNSL